MPIDPTYARILHLPTYLLLLGNYEFVHTSLIIHTYRNQYSEARSLDTCVLRFVVTPLLLAKLIIPTRKPVMLSWGCAAESLGQ